MSKEAVTSGERRQSFWAGTSFPGGQRGSRALGEQTASSGGGREALLSNWPWYRTKGSASSSPGYLRPPVRAFWVSTREEICHGPLHARSWLRAGSGSRMEVQSAVRCQRTAEGQGATSSFLGRYIDGSDAWTGRTPCGTQGRTEHGSRVEGGLSFTHAAPFRSCEVRGACFPVRQGGRRLTSVCTGTARQAPCGRREAEGQAAAQSGLRRLRRPREGPAFRGSVRAWLRCV